MRTEPENENAIHKFLFKKYIKKTHHLHSR